MSLIISLPWLPLLLLGAGHGINPAMGWLFAVARGLQERTGAAVWRTLGPLALGHALAMAVVIAAGLVLGRVLPLTALRWAVAATLVAFGVLRLVKTRHPSAGGMRVGPVDLTLWSFLMATAHGAGLMVLPFLIPAVAAGTGDHAGHSPAPIGVAGGGGHEHLSGLAVAGDQVTMLAATLIHTSGYLLVTGAVAALVYYKLGLRLLRTAWINLDLVWSVALICTGLLTLML